MKQFTALLENPWIAKAVGAFIIVTVVIVLMRLARRFVNRRVQDTNLRYQTRKAVGIVGWLVAIVSVAAIFSDKLGGLALSLGVVGAGVAFALQEVIASIAGRVAVMFQSFYEVGDRVQLGGIKGDVIDIGLLRTTIMEVGDWVKGDLFTGRVVRVANSFVFKEPVYNYSGDFAFLWDEVTVPVRYGCDHKLAHDTLEAVANEVTGEFVPQARAEWTKMLEKYQVEAAQVEPLVTLIANDNWMEFTIRYVVPYTRRRGIKNKLFTRILDEVMASDKKIELASATYELVAAPELRMRTVPAA